MVKRPVIVLESTNVAKILQNALDELAAVGVEVDVARDIVKR